MVDGGTMNRRSQELSMLEKNKCCGWSRFRCCFLILLFTAVAIFYFTDRIAEWAPKTKWALTWWEAYSGANGWANATSPHFNKDNHTSEYAQILQHSTGQQTEFSESTGHQTRLNTSTQQDTRLNLTHNETEAVLTERITNLTTAALTTPVPYVSPGPYYVEYPHEYHFILDEPEKCQQQKPFLVLMVPVAPYNREARDAVRSTWGSERRVRGKRVLLFFLLALPSGDGMEQLQEKVLQESKEHQDLLQSDFIDCYKNLTIKTMVMMEWLSSRCPNASYAMKIDSDMFLNVNTLVNMLLNAPKENYMTGLVARWGAVLRDPNSKWYLPNNVFSEMIYPPYALGLGYIVSMDLPRKLVEASRKVKAVYIEDVYLGLCMRQLGINPTDPPAGNLFNVVPVNYNRCTYSRLIASTTHSITDQVNAWKDLQKPGPPC